MALDKHKWASDALRKVVALLGLPLIFVTAYEACCPKRGLLLRDCLNKSTCAQHFSLHGIHRRSIILCRGQKSCFQKKKKTCGPPSGGERQNFRARYNTLVSRKRH